MLFRATCDEIKRRQHWRHVTLESADLAKSCAYATGTNKREHRSVTPYYVVQSTRRWPILSCNRVANMAISAPKGPVNEE